MIETANRIEPGQVVGGVYRITEIIGKGGFAEVWSALDMRLKRIVAVKIIPKGQTMAEEIAARFRQESLIITRLEHHYILPLYDFGEEDAFRYLVMRYVSGGSLADRLHGQMPIASADIIRWMVPIASALDYLHQQRIVHRDIKPGNILFNSHDSPYLADFGLAKELSDSTQQIHSASGTLVYMPPEQFYGEALSIQSDQYSLGILLYQLFTGKLPFNGEFAHGVRQLVNNEQLPNVQDSNPDLPFELNTVLRSLTASNPADRPLSAIQAINTIATLLGELAVTVVSTATLLELAIESSAFSSQEAELLLEKYVHVWNTDIYSLSRTHFVLLDMILSKNAAIMSPDARSLLLRGAFETGQQLDLWWMHATDSERKRASWNALNSSKREVCSRAVTAITPMAWAGETSTTDLNKVSGLLQVADYTDTALTFLECALPKAKDWLIDPNLTAVDINLQLLALGRDDVAKRAAHLIGTARRTDAAKALPTHFSEIGPLLSVYEAAGSLPKGHSMPPTTLLTIILVLRQLTADPRRAVKTYLQAAAGNGLGLAVMVFVVYRSLTFVDNVRVLNSIGQGLIFGAIYGLGVGLACHIRNALGQNVRPLRWLLAIVVGSVVLAIGFSIYQKLVYDDTIALPISIIYGALYVSGFVLTAALPRWFRLIGSALGIAAAYLIPWWLYLRPDSTIQPPFFFDESQPMFVIVLVMVSALLVSGITLIDLWLPASTRGTRSDTKHQTDARSLSNASPETTQF